MLSERAKRRTFCRCEPARMRACPLCRTLAASAGRRLPPTSLCMHQAIIACFFLISIPPVCLAVLGPFQTRQCSGHLLAQPGCPSACCPPLRADGGGGGGASGLEPAASSSSLGDWAAATKRAQPSFGKLAGARRPARPRAPLRLASAARQPVHRRISRCIYAQGLRCGPHCMLTSGACPRLPAPMLGRARPELSARKRAGPLPWDAVSERSATEEDAVSLASAGDAAAEGAAGEGDPDGAARAGSGAGARADPARAAPRLAGVALAEAAESAGGALAGWVTGLVRSGARCRAGRRVLRACPAEAGL